MAPIIGIFTYALLLCKFYLILEDTESVIYTLTWKLIFGCTECE